MKHSYLLGVLVLFLYLEALECLIQIELKKSLAKFHHEYLKSLKFMQVYTKNEIFTSFLEEKDVPLHQQV